MEIFGGKTLIQSADIKEKPDIVPNDGYPILNDMHPEKIIFKFRIWGFEAFVFQIL